MNTPGITTRPLINMAGILLFNEVFFEDVRIPATNLVGDENRGWYVGAALLDFERSGIGSAAAARRGLDELVEYCREARGDDKPLMADQMVRNRLADIAIETEMGRFLSYRVASMQAKGAEHGGVGGQGLPVGAVAAAGHGGGPDHGPVRAGAAGDQEVQSAAGRVHGVVHDEHRDDDRRGHVGDHAERDRVAGAGPAEGVAPRPHPATRKRAGGSRKRERSIKGFPVSEI
jgi:alkylation response protein AidB-like acyl-CoA dehydrogenase